MLENGLDKILVMMYHKYYEILVTVNMQIYYHK